MGTPGFIPVFSENHKKDPLHMAIVSDHLKKVALLMIDHLKQQENGVHYLNRQDNANCTALHYAAMHGSTLIDKLLAIPGIDYRSKDKQERTPLDSTAAARRTDVVKMLLKHGGTNSFDNDPEYLSRPLFLAIKPSGGVDNEKTIYPVVEALIHAGADPSRGGSRGSTYTISTTPISLAINHGFSSITRLFIESNKESVQRYLRDNAEDLLVSAVGLDSPHTANVLMQHAVFKDFLQEPGNKELLIEKAGNNAEMLDFIKTGHLKEPGLVGRFRATISAIPETGRFLYDHFTVAETLKSASDIARAATTVAAAQQTLFAQQTDDQKKRRKRRR